MAERSRPKEIREIHSTYKLFYVVMVISVALGAGILIGAAVFADDPNGYAMNLVTEGFGVAISVVITVFVIDRIYERRGAMRRTEELKRRLVREAGSRVNGTAVAAIEHMRHRGWLNGNYGILKGSFLLDANLQGADLNWADLQDATWTSANLQNADMISANLQSAKLSLANLRNVRLWRGILQNADLQMTSLQGANLWEADLRDADLNHANLHDADLRGVNLQGTNLRHANLQGTHLDNAELRGVLLPDGLLYTHTVDMKKYTDPDHPEYFDYSEKLRSIERTRKVR